MSLIEGLLIFLSILGLYFLLVIFLHKIGILEKFNISFYGPALLLRTKKGRNFLKRIAERKRFWKAFGSSGIVLCFIMMILMVSMLIWQVWAVSGFTPEQVEQLPGIEFVVILPGINPIIPLEYIWFIIIALAIAIIVHEFSHGILTFASKLKVKSLGILYLIVPIGAFCEPDEEQLKKAKPANRMRVFAAGPTSNFVVVLITIFLLSFVLMSAVQPAADGIIVYSVDDGSPADQLGIRPGDIITSINDTNLSKFIGTNFTMEYAFLAIEHNLNSSETVNLSFAYAGNHLTKQITLTDKYEEWSKRPDIYINNVEENKGRGYSGIHPLNGSIREKSLKTLKNPFTNFPDGFLFFFVLPLFGYFQGYNPITAPFNDVYIITGPLNVIPPGVFWGIVNALYWIFWLNLMVGLFNVLPMVPLDGGFLFNDALGSLIKRIKKDISNEQREKAVKNISLVISLTILFMVLFPFLIKYF